MASIRVVFIDEQGKTISEQFREGGGASVDDVARAARETLKREGCTIRSCSPTGSASVLVYAYPAGRAPRDMGAPPGWVPRRRAPST